MQKMTSFLSVVFGERSCWRVLEEHNMQSRETDNERPVNCEGQNYPDKNTVQDSKVPSRVRVDFHKLTMTGYFLMNADIRTTLVIFTLWYVLLLLLLISFCFFVLMMNDIAMYIYHMAILIHFCLTRSASNFCITHGNADSFLFEPFSFQFLYYHY